MKPVLFKNQKDLILFIQKLPRPEGRAKVGNEMLEASQMLDKCQELAPSIFEYRKVLAKGAGGLGNFKSVDRFYDAAAVNAANEKVAAFNDALANLEVEMENLINYGASEELVSKMKSAKTAVARLTLVKETILAFKQKLQRQMDRVEAAYKESVTAITKVVETNKDSTLQRGLLITKEEIQKLHKNTQVLKEAMDKYCDLQVGYNSILIGGLA
jgi:hypothetical protein